MGRMISAMWLLVSACAVMLFWFATGDDQVDAIVTLLGGLTNTIDQKKVMDEFDQTLVNPCSWTSLVGCNGNSVIRITLSRQPLSGQLSELNDPDHVKALSALTHLSIYECGINGSIPLTFGKFTNLIQVHLNGNKLSGQIPENLGSLPSLSVLMLQDNLLSGKVPENLILKSASMTLNVSNNVELDVSELSPPTAISVSTITTPISIGCIIITTITCALGFLW
ncbi:unnamed protein product [Cuscuta epithymum]|uniref:Leucine-rich repeat-containing N-terminal plant-type domain-containing protein n=1 Tax=Cuscuta epithymum TaxID=186058 RepID=A0AAV0DYP7_9ASTE|nr:unnamed protein product [Cuscuta epithymum]